MTVTAIPSVGAGSSVTRTWPAIPMPKVLPANAIFPTLHGGRVSASGPIKVQWKVGGALERVTFLTFGQDEFACSRYQRLDVEVTNMDPSTAFDIYVPEPEE